MFSVLFFAYEITLEGEESKQAVFFFFFQAGMCTSGSSSAQEVEFNIFYHERHRKPSVKALQTRERKRRRKLVVALNA